MGNNIRAGGVVLAPTRLLKLLPLLVGLSPAVALAQYHLAFGPGPSTTTAGQPIRSGGGGAVKVAVQDPLGNTVTTSTAAITVAIYTNPGGGTLSGTLTVNAVAGIASFSDLSINMAGVGYRLSAWSLGLSGATSNSFNITAGPPSRLAFTTPSRTFTAGVCGGAAQVITVQLQDAFGNPAAAPSGGYAFTASSTSTGTVVWCTDSACSLLATGGNFTIAASSTNRNVYYMDTKAGTPSISLTNGSGLTNPPPQSHTVSAAAENRLAFIVQPASTTVGAAFSPAVQVIVQDTFGNTVTSSTASITVAIGTNPGGGTLSGTTTVAAVSGMATFSNLSLDQVGTGYTLAAASGSLIGATSAAFNISPAPATKLAFTVEPTSATAGSAISPSVQVTVQDAFGNTVTTSTASIMVAIESNPGGGTLSGTTTVAAVGGVATFSNLSIDKVGTDYTLMAAAPPLTGATSAAFNISHAAATKLVFTGQPASGTAGGGPWVQVTVQDAFGNTVTSSTASITLALGNNPCGGTLWGTTTAATVGGVATFSNLSITEACIGYTLTAAAAALTGAESESFDISPAAASRLAFTVQPTNATAGASISPAVRVQDAFNNTVTTSTASITVAIGTDPGGGTLSGTTTVAAVAGVATFSNLSIDKVGTGYTLTATSGGLTGAISSAFDISPAAASRLAFTAQPTDTTIGAAISPAVQVTVQDAFNNTVTTTASITVAFGTNPGGGTLSGTTTVSAASGVATFSNLSIDKVGTGYTLTAASAALTGATSSAFNISLAPPIKLAFSTPPRQAGAGICSPVLTIEARDSLDKASPVASTVPVNLSSTSTTVAFFSDPLCTVPVSGSVALVSDSSAVSFYFQESVPGQQTLTAEATGFTPASQIETVVAAGAPSALAFITPPPTFEANACSPAVMAETQDQNGVTAPVTAAMGNVTVALTSASTTLSFYSDATCTTGITQVTLAAGQSRAILHLMDTAARPTTITASDQAAVLTSANQDATVVCPAVGTAACDDNDVCNGRETCQAGVCTPSAPPSCDDGNRCTTDTCQPATGCSNEPVSDPTCCVPSAILEEANPNAAVGVPYRYGPSGTARMSPGTGPIAWSLCDSSPAGFRIDATTGRVDWTPAVAGMASVCLAAQGTCGQFEYRFSVTVAPTPPPMPVASLTLTPSTVGVGAPLTADGRLSSTTQPPLYALELDFGDGSPLAYGDLVTHAYQKPGSYPVRLRVYDSVGQFADAVALAKVADAFCASPPQVRIAASPATGQDRLTVSFTSTYDGSDPGAVYRWDLGDGATATGPSITHEYTAGHYTARLSVVSAQGCTSVDAVPIAVDGADNRAPYCWVNMTPAAGPVPLPVAITATFGDVDGYVASATWLFSDGIIQDATRYNGTAFSTLSNPGRLGVTLRVVDDRGLVCRASAEAEAGNADGVLPPEIVSTPTLTARCDEPYVYGQDGLARATGSRPLTWSLGRGDPAVAVPAGMTIDGNGQIQWTPGKKAAKEPVTVVVENAAGVAQQDFVVDVQCTPAPCGCSSGAGVVPLALLLLASLTRRKRSRPGQTSRGEGR